MARQTLLSFLGAGKGKKEEKTQEKEMKANNKMDSLKMTDVEEDIFAHIPEKESKAEDDPGTSRSVFERLKAAGAQDEDDSERQSEERQDSNFPDGWWNEEKPEVEPEEAEEWGFGKTESDPPAEKQKAEEQKSENKKSDDFFSDIIEPEYEVEKAKSIYFEIVLDKTISMAKIYKPIYKKLEKMIDNMDRAVKNYQKKGKVGLKWGLTLITEEEPEMVRFNESYFTTSSDRIKIALKEFQFEGGAGNGRENINEALTAAIGTLSRESQGEGRCGLILLTDSLPEEEDAEPDFEYLENVEHTELCFAHCFVYNCEAYTPYFNMVDGEGETDVKGIHYLEIRDLDAFLNREADNLTEKLLKKLLHQTSISG